MGDSAPGAALQEDSKSQRVLGGAQRFPPGSPSPGAPRVQLSHGLSSAFVSMLLASVWMDALLLGHSGSANSLITAALIPSAFPGLCRATQLMPFSGFSSGVLRPALTAMACQRAPTLALL